MPLYKKTDTETLLLLIVLLVEVSATGCHETACGAANTAVCSSTRVRVPGIWYLVFLIPGTWYKTTLRVRVLLFDETINQCCRHGVVVVAVRLSNGPSP